MIRYRRVTWPASITGDKADYRIELDGADVGYARGTPAGRSYGRAAHWRAHLHDGTRLTGYSTFRALKRAVELHVQQEIAGDNEPDTRSR